MTTLKEDAKDIGLSVAYDLMLVAFVICWVMAIILAFLEISIWIVFGVFLLGCGIFFALLHFTQKNDEEGPKLSEKETQILDEQLEQN